MLTRNADNAKVIFDTVRYAEPHTVLRRTTDVDLYHSKVRELAACSTQHCHPVKGSLLFVEAF